MPKRKPRTPGYCLQKSTGLAYVRLGSEWRSLGPYGTPESRDLYDALLGEWLQRGRKPVEAKIESAPLTVSQLILQYYRFAETHYGARRTAKTRLSQIRMAVKPLKALFGSTPANAFGPKRLLLVRDQYVAAGWTRKTINDQIQTVKRLFAWGVREEVLAPSVEHGLRAVKGLKAGESVAKESRKVQAVQDCDVDAVLQYVLPPVRAMMELQRLTGMRPGEVTIMRGCDLDMTSPLWLYTPRYHKSDTRGIVREIYLGERAQAIVKPFLQANVEAFLFRPDLAVADWQADKRRRRKSRVQPSQRSRASKSAKRVPRDHYKVSSYAQAIMRGCMKAWPCPPEVAAAGKEAIQQWRADKGAVREWNKQHVWTPHRLRHSFATRIKKEHGIEAARIILGHQHVATTEIYTERDRSVAQTIAAKLG